jgi:Tat protein secretion system quality control protein TatD with DNase activity
MPRRGAAQRRERAGVGIEQHLVALARVGHQPEIAHERAGELDLLLTQIRDVAAIGEVGLDGSSRYSKSYDVQRGLLRPSLNVAQHWAVVCSVFIHAKL